MLFACFPCLPFLIITFFFVLQVNRESAEKVCDKKIAERLLNRKKHAAHSRRKRTRSSVSTASWIQKLNARKSPSKECNTPKRSSNSLRRGRSAGAIPEPNVFSPLAPSMTRKPTKPVKVKKKTAKTQVVCRLFVLSGCVIETRMFACLCLRAQDKQALLQELRRRAKQAVAKRVAKRVERYKKKLKEQLPSQITVWSAREERLLKIISGTSGVPIAALLIRQCPDPPAEVDPDTDDEAKKEDECEKKEVSKISVNDDPTIRAWTASDEGRLLVLPRPHSSRLIN